MHRPEASQITLERIRARQAIIIAAFGFIVSLITIGRDFLVPKASQDELITVQKNIDEDIGDRVRDEIKRSPDGKVVVDLENPIGTIIASALTFEELCEFLNQPGPNSWNAPNIEKFKWVPADGRIVAGSKYSDYNNKVPDLRGVFLRGRNKFDESESNRVASNRMDPEGDRAVGDFQTDAARLRHRHDNGSATEDGKDLNIYGNAAEVGRRDAWTGAQPNMHTGWTQWGGEEAPETRPKNISINYFIKIN